MMKRKMIKLKSLIIEQEEEKKIYAKYKNMLEKDNEQEDTFIQPVQSENNATAQTSRQTQK